MSEDPLLLGGRYEVGELIGRGGMAEVHLGHDTRLGRQVAIKMLRSDLARDQSFIKRFRREAQSSAGLNHASIVAVYDSGEDHSIESGGAKVAVPYMVMEYVQGRTLREVLTERDRLPTEEASRVTEGVLDALAYSHRMGIVHRDIKPANVMIAKDGTIKVMDFGIARAIADTAATMTQTQAVIGTAQYLSPEQAQGQNVDARSDLYSAGCMLYELLVGPPAVRRRQPRLHRLPARRRAAGRRRRRARTRSARSSTPSSCTRWPRTARSATRTPVPSATTSSPPGSGARSAPRRWPRSLRSPPDPPPSPRPNPPRCMPRRPVPGTASPAARGAGRRPRRSRQRSTADGAAQASRRDLGHAHVRCHRRPRPARLRCVSSTSRCSEEANRVSVPECSRASRGPRPSPTSSEVGLTSTQTTAKSDTVPEDSVISQNPERPAARVDPARRGSALVISTGPNAVTVPDLTGMTVAEATACLEERQARGRQDRQGRHQRRSPRTGSSRATRGRDVAARRGRSSTSTSPRGQVAVPKLTGMTQDEACDAARQGGSQAQDRLPADLARQGGHRHRPGARRGRESSQWARPVTIVVAQKPPPPPVTRTPSATPTPSVTPSSTPTPTPTPSDDAVSEPDTLDLAARGPLTPASARGWGQPVTLAATSAPS